MEAIPLPQGLSVFRATLYDTPISEPEAAPILQSRLPILPWTEPALWRLPGIQPLDPECWLEVDAAHAAQMGEKADPHAGGAGSSWSRRARQRLRC